MHQNRFITTFFLFSFLFFTCINAKLKKGFIYHELIVRHIKNHNPTKKILIGHPSPVYSVHITPDEKFVVTESTANDALVWDLQTGQLLHELRTDVPLATKAAAFDDLAHFIITGFSMLTIRLWDLETGECLKELEGHTGSINDVVVSSSGKFVVSGSDDCTAIVWDIIDQEFIDALQDIKGVQANFLQNLFEQPQKKQICQHHPKWKLLKSFPTILQDAIQECLVIQCTEKCPIQ